MPPKPGDMLFGWPVDPEHRWISGYTFLDPRNPDHRAIDLGTIMGANLYAAQSGLIDIARFTLAPNTTGKEYGYGNYIRIDHGNGWSTISAHLLEGYVKVGDRVKLGQLIGKCDNTGWSSGNHLHFSIKHNGVYVNPLDGYLVEEPGTPEPPPPDPTFPVLPKFIVQNTEIGLNVRDYPGVTTGKILYKMMDGTEVGGIRLVKSGSDIWLKIGHREYCAMLYHVVSEGNKEYVYLRQA